MASDYRNKFKAIADEKLKALCEESRKRLLSYIEYEYTIANMELASRAKDHGDDFKTLPHEMIEQIRTSVTSVDGNYKVSLSIGQESLKNVDDDLISFFKTYVLGNASQRLTYGVK